MKLRTIFGLMLVFILVACGTIKIDIDSTVKDLEDFSHSYEITATGALANMIEQSIREGNGSENESPVDFDIVTKEGTLTLSGTHRFRGDEATNLLNSEENDIISGFNLTATDTPEGTIYRASYFIGNLTEAASNDSDSGDGAAPFGFEESMLGMMQSMFLFNWTVEMPGEIINSNADRVSESTAIFSVDFVELQDVDEIWVESLVTKSDSGSCNAS